MSVRAAAAALCGLVVAGCVQTPEQIAAEDARIAGELAGALEGRAAGAPANCMPYNQMGGPQVIGEGAVLYRENGNRTWLARTEGECPALRRDVVLVVEPFSGGQLCRNDRFRVLERGASIPSGYCRFGSFTPYDRR